jgi:hypothetical protein
MRSNSNVIMYSFCVFNFCLGSFWCDLKNPATLQRDVRAASLDSFLNHLGKQNQPYNQCNRPIIYRDTTLCPTQYLFNTNFLELLNILNR